MQREHLKTGDGVALTPRRASWGRALGDLMAPVTGFISHVRHARMFHPDGVVYLGRVEPVATSTDLGALSRRLAGPAIVRLSSAWWRGGKEWPDVLGLAVRFIDAARAPDAAPHDGDQDLLFATIRLPWTTPLAPLVTHVSSFLWNHFYAVSPFAVEGVGRVKLRLRSPRISNDADQPRAEHLDHIVDDGCAIYRLEARRLGRSPLARRWEPVAHLVLEHPLAIDQARLRFCPFLEGRGIHPVGFVHHLRLGTYAASQRARPSSSSPRAG